MAVGRRAAGVVDPTAGVLAGPTLEAAVHQGEMAGPRVVGAQDPTTEEVGAQDPTAEVGVAATAAGVGPTRAALHGEVVVGEVAEGALRARRWCPG